MPVLNTSFNNKKILDPFNPQLYCPQVCSARVSLSSLMMLCAQRDELLHRQLVVVAGQYSHVGGGPVAAPDGSQPNTPACLPSFFLTSRSPLQNQATTSPACCAALGSASPSAACSAVSGTTWATCRGYARIFAASSPGTGPKWCFGCKALHTSCRLLGFPSTSGGHCPRAQTVARWP